MFALSAKKDENDCIKAIVRSVRENACSVVEDHQRDGLQRLKGSDEKLRNENGGSTRVKGAETRRIFDRLDFAVYRREMNEIKRAVRLVDDARKLVKVVLEQSHRPASPMPCRRAPWKLRGAVLLRG